MFSVDSAKHNPNLMLCKTRADRLFCDYLSLAEPPQPLF